MKNNSKMSPETRNTFKLGVFISMGLILLIIAVYLIGSKKNMFTATFHISACFSDVNGLQSGDAVRFRGINIGTVKEITVLNDSTINVLMIFEEKIKPYVKKSAIASIVTDGLMGNKMVNIRNENISSKNIEENDVLKTSYPIDMEDVTRKLKSSNDNMAAITTNLYDITDKINKGKGAIGTLIMDTAFAKNLKESIQNLKAGTNNIDKESEALKHNILFRRYFKKEEKK
ncbi:MAG TPA: MlaD family protein [Bacteroidia bacterium]|nr:MlaD family protein [Bacteroidia bacterium]